MSISTCSEKMTGNQTELTNLVQISKKGIMIIKYQMNLFLSLDVLCTSSPLKHCTQLLGGKGR